MTRSSEMVLVVAIAALFIVFSIIANGFFTLNNVLYILRSMATVAVLALGTTLVLTSGNIDLSIGYLPAFCACIVAVCLKEKMPLGAGIALSAGVAAAVGLINGLIVYFVKMPSIIVTLSTGMIVNGASYVITAQKDIYVSDVTMKSLFGGNIGGFPVIVLWMIIVGVICYVLLHKTKFGRNVEFIGENDTASFFSGIKVGKTLVLVFLFCALCSCLASYMQVGLGGYAKPYMMQEYMMTAIAAAIVGGTSLSGGEGTMVGTLLGALLLTIISNGFLICGVSQWVLYLINGIVIIGTLSLRYMPRKKRKLLKTA